MSKHGFNGTDRYLVSQLAKSFLDSYSFQTIIGRSACAMGADVIHLRRCNSAFRERYIHRPRGALSLWMGRGHVVRIAPQPVSANFTINACAASNCSLFKFQ